MTIKSIRGAAPQVSECDTFFLSLDCDGLGAQAQVWRTDETGIKTLVAMVGHETKKGGAIGSVFDPFDTAEPCYHESKTGVDQTPIDDPKKVWLCDSCGNVFVGAALEEGVKVCVTPN